MRTRQSARAYHWSDRHLSARVDRRIWSNFDVVMLLLTAALIGIGLTNLYSATYGGVFENLYYVQLSSVALAAAAMLIGFLIPYRVFEAASYWVYIAGLIMLAAVLLVGRESHGAQRWLEIGPVSFQPSELTQIALAMALARYFSANPNYQGYGVRELVLPGLLMAAPVLLVLAEPDLGTALMHVLVFITVALFMRVRRSTLTFAAVSAVVLAPVGWLFILKEYQKERILTLIDPGRDPLGAGYHIQQSKIAIGSGQWTGKGFLEGTQTRLQFLPEHHTDFVFSVFAEEWGIAGCTVVLLLFFLLLLKGATVALQSKDRFGSILAIGLTSIVFWHVAVNLLMVVGMAPVVGVTLPFFSYGRTSLVVTCLVIGLLLNIRSRRYMFEAL